MNACLNAGMDDFISKPFQIAQLLQTLGRWTQITPTPTASI